MRSSNWPRRAAAATLVLLAAACTEAAAPPSFTDPAAFNTELANVEGAFNTLQSEPRPAHSGHAVRHVVRVGRGD